MKELANILFPDIKLTVEDLLKKYPPRGHVAMRLGPSPTGELHIGTVGMAMCNMRLAKAMGGIAFLRIEDTDQKREVEGATDRLQQGLRAFGIEFDEHEGKGKYGPYTQSKRTELYHVYAKRLVEIGRAYPCFCTPDDLAKIREQQQSKNERTGYNSSVSQCRKLSVKQVEENLKKNIPWVLRFDSTPDAGQKIEWKDLIRGDMSLPAEENHFIILKANGMPPYNFAHVVDDTLMRTSHVLRGEEWLISAAEHIQIARALGPVPYLYAHMPVICVLDNGNKRKLSKRKDKEALASTFIELGYPVESVIEYLSTVVYPVEGGFEKITPNSPLFDWDKLDSISREIIARKTKKEIEKEATAFIGSRSEDLLTLLNIGRETDKPRKDLAKYSDIYDVYDFLFKKPMGAKLTSDEEKVYQEFLSWYNSSDGKETWLTKMKGMSEKIQVVAKIVSKAVIGREQSPDLYTVLKIVEGQHGLPK